MRVLVTGGTGFIGSHLAEALLADGHEVVSLDSLDPCYAVGFKEHNLRQCRAVSGERFSFVEGSITDRNLIEETVGSNDFDVIYHEAPSRRPDERR